MGIYGNQGIFATFNGSAFDVISNYSLPTNSWQYLTAIHKQNGLVEIYLNANLIYTHQVSTPNINLTNGYIGVAPWGSSYWNGKIDNSSIWDRALSQQEIQQYMNCPPTGSELGLVGYWNFEEGSGSTVYDQTSNGNNGTVNGAQYESNVPPQSCQLTTTNGCDSVAVLNLTINQSDTSYTNVTACDSYSWGDSTYAQSGTYYSNIASNNRNIRNQLLQETDWTANSDVTMSSDMKTYRKALRDLPTHKNWPNLESSDWPTKPS